MQRDITRQEALGFILRGILEGIGFTEVAVALVNREEHELRGELGLGMPKETVHALRVPLIEEENLLVMALARKSPVGIVHLRSSGLGDVLARPLEEGAWRESIGAEVSGAKAAFVAVPLIAREETVGVIVAARTERALVRRHELELLLLYANTAALTVERAELYARMHASLESLEVTDHVTRLFTSRHGQQRTGETLASCEKEGLPFAALMLGIDAFQAYNDLCGHELGDRGLAEIGTIVKAALRGGDVAFRYSGRLIAVLLPGASGEQAAAVAGGVRERMHRHRFPGPGGQRDQSLTLSVGLGAWEGGGRLPVAGEVFRTVLGRLQRAEAEGGDRIQSAGA